MFELFRVMSSDVVMSADRDEESWRSGSDA